MDHRNSDHVMLQHTDPAAAHKKPPLTHAIHLEKHGPPEMRGSSARRVGWCGAQVIEPSVRAGVSDPRPQQTHRVG